MLRFVSKTICLSLIGLFNPLEAFQKNQKDGFFIEAGFETLFIHSHKKLRHFLIVVIRFLIQSNTASFSKR